MSEATDHLTEEEIIQRWFSQFLDHQYWAKFGYWSLHQGVSLLLDKCPDMVGENIITECPDYDYRSPFVDEYKRLLTIAQTTLKDDKKLFQKILPPKFIKWADDKDIPVPDALREAVTRYHGKKEVKEPDNIDQQNAAIQNVANASGVESFISSIIEPKRKNDWLECIQEHAISYCSTYNSPPNESTLWHYLHNRDSDTWNLEIKSNTLSLDGVPLSRESFSKRFKKYFPS